MRRLGLPPGYQAPGPAWLLDTPAASAKAASEPPWARKQPSRRGSPATTLARMATGPIGGEVEQAAAPAYADEPRPGVKAPAGVESTIDQLRRGTSNASSLSAVNASSTS